MREVLVKNEEFKNSPVGRIPKDWQVDKLVSRASVFGGKRLPLGHSYSDNPTKFRYLRVVDFFERDIDFEALEFLKPSTFKAIERYEIHEGNLFISIAGSLGYVGVFRIKYEEQRTILTENAARIVLHDDSLPEFIAYQMNNSVVQKQIEAEKGTGGGVPKLALFRIENFLLTFPPREEQEKIVAILQTLDEAIARTSSLIIKLKQTKAGLLQDLLTRGLDEDGKLRDPQAHPEQFKDSPLGRIPKDWEAKPLAAIADLQVGFAFKSEWFQEHDGVKLLRGENVGYGVPDWSETRKLPWNMYFNYREYELVAGDIIIGMDRTFTKSGVKISVLEASDVPALLVQRVGRFLPIECDPQFLKTLLSSQQYHNILLAQQKGMDIPHLSKSEILDPLVTVPPIEEQIRIAAIIDTHDNRIRTEEAYLNKLKLQKQGLMQDLLTGKVRVKNL